MGRVVMLSGPIGAGKTTVARELVAIWEGPLAYIEGDSFWPYFAKPKEGERGENFRILMRSMTAASLPFARSGYDVLLDFSVPTAFLPVALVILKDTKLDFILLRPSLAVCAERALQRKAGKIRKYDAGFYDMFAGADEYAVADDDGDARAVALKIRAGLAAGQFRAAAPA
jgi:chloramphenicol 3-O-phosphotransferase